MKQIIFAIALWSTISFGQYSDWGYKSDITINTTLLTGVPIAEDVHNVPVSIRLTESNFDFSKAKSNGEDIRFASASETPMAYEIEEWTSTSALIWVLVDTVKGNTEEQGFTMYWGKSDATSESNGEAVFNTNNDFQMVLHLNEESGDIKDRTQNALDFEFQNGAASATGVLGKGMVFDGVDDQLSGKKAMDVDFGTGITLSGWFNYSLFDTWARSLNFQSASGNTDNAIYFLGTALTGDMRFQIRNGGAITIDDPIGFTATIDEWFHMLVTVASNGDAFYYVNGVQVGSKTGVALPPQATRDMLLIAGHHPNLPGDGLFGGTMDEVRLSNTDRSASWVKLSYESQLASQSFIEVGDEEVVDNGGSSVVALENNSFSKNVIYTGSNTLKVPQGYFVELYNLKGTKIWSTVSYQNTYVTFPQNLDKGVYKAKYQKL